MAPDRGRRDANMLGSMLSTAPQDRDPETLSNHSDSADSDASSDSAAQESGARDHYVEVGKSKLQRRKAAALRAQYRGAKISRDAVSEDEDEDDPFAGGLADEQSEEEETMRDTMNRDAEASGRSEDEGDRSEGSDEEDAGTSDGEGAPASQRMANGTASREARYEMLKTLSQDQREVTSTLAQSNRADAEKGRAVKRQRTGFDKLLGVRIKLQKAMVGANSIVDAESSESRRKQDEKEESIARAETAAFNLWSSLNNLREDLIDARAGQKRKRTTLTPSTPSSHLWSHTQQQEESSLPHRNAALQRWSVKTRSVTIQPQHSLLSKSERSQPTIIDALQSHLSNPDRLMKKAHTPRSCAPLQLAAGVDEDEKIYDDADFYSLLLTSLLEQKSSESTSLPSVVDLNLDLRTAAKAKKNVDTKASKGRKLRYTVHEKLQNFMAPEDRRQWGERQCEELFGGLFGRSVTLQDGIDEDGDGLRVEEDERLPLFEK